MQPSMASVAALKIKHLRNKIEITKKWKALFIPHAIKLIYNHIQQTCIDVMGNLQTLRAKNK